MLTKKEILKLAEFSKIQLSKKEESTLLKDINNILNYVKKVQQYPISEKIKSNNSKYTNLRKDKIKTSQSDLLISQFADKKDNLLRVKKVL
ncbi:MAG TPA: Asp-tRNA(Asn)/Glu-tRNA(Gln) amidotransferase subunit GatC [bacterium]|jgi:aspartyl/glutamyl-tRNA(Asn/Gln) amidotransferase C subunit|nr:Asp-tRNA(Asn)/Glu-tRNA(Gln) amidotransferase subunit GatC [bacterium]HOG37965.1 Asp-tRNA(Asn)/Glu-tRNA(Gln) amidotransferase subunit GatC [bacterium]HQI03024.1 Asp-tRNA(Asn)/Glu-tRNA(Gln) amidotransferase subunit GatC [bacterium]